MTKNFKLLLEETRELGLSVDIVYPEKEVAEISDGAKKIIVKELFSFAEDPYSASAVLAKNKEITYRFWERAGVPFPRSCYFKDVLAFPKNADDLHLRFPVVFKKSNGKKSIGVRPNIVSFQDLAKIVADSEGGFIVQEMAFGKEYRLLLFKGRLLGALEHAPPQVIGDGAKTVAELIQERNAAHTKKMSLTGKVIQTIGKNGFTPESIPGNGVSVVLLETSCLSEGATSTDCTAIVHEGIIEFAKKSAQATNTLLAGLDLICEDISKDPREQTISFLETNSSPSLSIHYTPTFGEPRRVIKYILQDVFNK